MKNVKLFFTFMAIVSCSGFVACDQDPFNNCNQDYYLDSNNEFVFEVLDKKTRKNVLHVLETPYFYDTVTVYNEDWTRAYNGRIPFDGRVVLGIVDAKKDDGVVDQLISKRFYMYFNYQDIDTIDFDFEMTMDRCNNQVMKTFKVAYNDSIYSEGSPDFFVQFLK